MGEMLTPEIVKEGARAIARLRCPKSQQWWFCSGRGCGWAGKCNMPVSNSDLTASKACLSEIQGKFILEGNLK